MSVFYYLREKEKYKELDNYLAFIDSLFSEASKNIENYQTGSNINLFKSHTIKILDDAKNEIKKNIIYNEIFIGTEKIYGFKLSNKISLNEIKDLCNTGKYCIVNEYHEEVSLEDFLEKIKR